MPAVTPETALFNCTVIISAPPDAFCAKVSVHPEGILISSPSPAPRTLVFPTVMVALVPLVSCRLTWALFDNTNLPMV